MVIHLLFVCIYIFNQCIKLIFVQGACRSINELPHLEELSVSHCPKIENSLLKAALAIDRSLRVYCKNTNVQIDEFVKEFPDTVKHCADKCDTELRCRKGCEYRYQNLKLYC